MVGEEINIKDCQLTAEGFNAMFEARMNAYPTYKEAYDQVEKIHFLAFGKMRYDSYQSFYVTRYQKIRKNK